MAKKIILPLEMANGVKARTLEELKNSWDLESVISYYLNGRLLSWLKARRYGELAEQVAALQSVSDKKELPKHLCDIFTMPFEEEKTIDVEAIIEKNKKIEKLRRITAEDTVLKNVDNVALNQEELERLLAENKRKILLYNNTFTIPLAVRDVKYIGYGDVTAVVESDKRVDFASLGISFENIKFDDKYENVNKKQDPDAVLNAVKAVAKEGAKVMDPFSGLVDDIVGGNRRTTNNNVGEAERLYKEGWRYEHGDGVEIDLERAKALYKEAEKMGNKLAAARLKFLTQVVIPNVVSSYFKAAENGDPVAMYNLGLIYEQGQFGEKINLDEACNWYEQAVKQGYLAAQQKFNQLKIQLYTRDAENGDPAAMYNLGLIFEHGRLGEKVDYKAATKWYELAVKNGYSAAQQKLNQFKSIFDINLEQVVFEGEYKEILMAANQGNPKAMYNMGLVYEEGKYGKAANAKIAENWYKQAANKAKDTDSNLSKIAEIRASAMNYLLLGIFEIGFMGRRSLGEFEVTYKAAINGDAEAMYNMGHFYEIGKHVTRDLRIACMWYALSSKYGYPNAIYKLEQYKTLVKSFLQ